MNNALAVWPQYVSDPTKTSNGAQQTEKGGMVLQLEGGGDQVGYPSGA